MSILLTGKDKETIFDVLDITSKMLKRPVIAALRFGQGANSQVYQLKCGNQERYIAKFYFRHPADPRDRLGAEFGGLSFLWQEGLRCIPQPVAADEDKACGIYEYIDGEKILSPEITEKDNDYAVGFLLRLKDLKDKEKSDDILPASEACFSVKAVFENITVRLERLDNVEGREEADNVLRSFLENDFAPFFHRLQDWCHQGLEQAGLSFGDEISRPERTLSPSDFGFHNALRRKDGRIVFLDFEYFGWDDPAKMVADFLLHPAMSLTEHFKTRFVRAVVAGFQENPFLRERIKLLYPFFGLKWCLIFLNEFVPDDFRRRDYARMESHSDKEALLTRQLLKASALLDKIQNTYQKFSYDT